jgi:hypothetical protein
VSADNSGNSPLIANKKTNQQWESFFLTKNPDGSLTIESQANWNFVCADNYGKNPLIANRVSTSSWESFFFSTNPFAALSTTGSSKVDEANSLNYFLFHTMISFFLLLSQGGCAILAK